MLPPRQTSSSSTSASKRPNSNQSRLGFISKKPGISHGKKAVVSSTVAARLTPVTQVKEVIELVSDNQEDVQSNTNDELDSNESEYEYESKKILGARDVNKIHADQLTKIDHILRDFDHNLSYGPCVGMTRLERWERAEKMGLSPPPIVHKILVSKQGIEQDSLRECVFYDQV